MGAPEAELARKEAETAPSGCAFVVIVDLVIEFDAAAQFMSLIRANARASLANEPGCHRFDICVDVATSLHILLYEVYDDASAFAAHCDAQHFKAFDRESAAMIASKSVRRFEVRY